MLYLSLSSRSQGREVKDLASAVENVEKRLNKWEENVAFIGKEAVLGRIQLDITRLSYCVVHGITVDFSPFQAPSFNAQIKALNDRIEVHLDDFVLTRVRRIFEQKV